MDNYTRHSIGLDISDRDTKVHVEKPDGATLHETTLPLDRTVLAAYLQSLKGLNPVIAFEAGTHSNWLYEFVTDLGFKDVLVANPRQVKLITRSNKKTDRVDAKKLSRLARVEPALLAATQPRGMQARLDRALLSTRALLVRTRTQWINHVRGTVKSMGGRLADCESDRFHLFEATLPGSLAASLAPTMKLIEQLTANISELDAKVMEIGKQHRVVSQLEKVSGIGWVTALSFVSCIEDPHRFKCVRNVGAFLGMVPRIDDSGSVKKQLSITKSGDEYLRHLLVSSAQTILKQSAKDCDLKRWGRALMERGGKNAKKRAAVAVARKLAVLLLSLWKSGQAYRLLKNQPEEPTSTVPIKRAVGARRSKATPTDAGIAA